MVRSTSEDVITGELVQALRVLNPRWWLADFLNRALGTPRFRRQYYRRLRITPWVNAERYPREFLAYDEGSTQVDCAITWDNPATTIFIEAKYGADLSTSTANSDRDHRFPTDQLLRNIRVGLYQCGYFHQEKLFDSPPRDFAVILLSPERGNPLVKAYRDEQRLRDAIPHSKQLMRLPNRPFVGELGYADVVAILETNRRFFTRAERAVIEHLTAYLDFKKGTRRRWSGWHPVDPNAGPLDWSGNPP